MSYTLYIGEDCHDCGLVVSFIEKNHLDVSVVNLDKDARKPPIEIFIRPALFRNDDLAGYGVDIIAYLKKNLVRH